jgi:hypothetical protein
MGYERLTLLRAGEALVLGQSITAQDGRFELILDTFGDLVLYPLPFAGTDTRLWRSNTQSRDAQVAIMQADGNFVMYDSVGHALWSTKTDGHPGAYLGLQNDGNVVIYDASNKSIWATDTSGH